VKHDFEWVNLIARCKTCGKKVTAASMMGGPGNPFEEECQGGATAHVYINGQPYGTIGHIDYNFVPEFNADGWKEFEKKIEPLKDACECGAHKGLGIGKHQVGHSSWCPWRQP
jgi:hypothetical protein